MTNDDALLQDEQDSIAIIGMAARMPGAADVDAFWRNLRDGVESIATFTEAELLEAGLDLETIRHPDFIATKGYLDGADQFDAAFFGISPREAELMDPQHRLLMECAWQAMEHAGYDAEAYDGRVAVYTSAGMNTYLPLNILSNPGLAETVGGFQLSIFNDKDFVPTRIAYALNVQGPGVDIGTACSSSLVSTHFACQSLITYQADMALVGGITVHLPQKHGHIHEPGSAYSPDGHCRPFDATPSGLVDGNGMAAVVLKRLADALADGDTIHAVIKGTAINNDGSKKLGYAAPSIEGQAAVIVEAQSVANCPPDTISYVETHGTATPLGDPVEVAGLTRAFRTGTQKTGFCGLGAVKSNIGHVDKAAGLAGLIKTVLALRHEMIPPTLHFQAPNPKLNLPETPFYVVNTLQPWPRRKGTPRRAGISSFGVGGTNAHAILEEAPLTEPGSPSRPVQIVTLSARTDSALQAVTDDLASYLEQTPGADLADVCHTLQRGRRPFAHRRTVVCTGVADAVQKLRSPQPAHYCERGDQGVAFLFPGQGSQYPGMARDLYRSEPVFRDEIDTCARHLQADLGLDIRTLLFPADGAAEAAGRTLAQTAVTQPVLFAVEYALARLLMSWGLTPSAMIGHSLGEYVAACLAGVFSLADALSLIAARGRLMQSMAPGAMLAVPLAEDALRPRLGNGVELAAVNAPGLCVVAGPEAAVAAFQVLLDAEGVACTRLHTSHAFHSAMMEPAVEPFLALLRRVRFSAPRIPYLSNLTGTWITEAEATRPEYWANHLRQPVRFADGLARLLERMPVPLVEVGPGRTLSTFAARAGGAAACFPTLPQPKESRGALETLLHAVAELWKRGVAPDWSGFYRDERRRRVPLPTYPFQRQSYWVAPGKRTAAAPVTAGKRTDVADWFHLPGWRAAVAPAPRTDADGTTLVFTDTRGVGTALADELARLDRPVVTVRAGAAFAKDSGTAYTIDPAQTDDFTALFDELLTDGALPRRIVHLWGLTGEGVAEGAPAIARHTAPALALVQALAWLALDEPVDLTIVADRLRGLDGEAAADPAKAALLGLTATIPWEHPAIRCRAIDVAPADPAAALARRLVRELDAPAEERIVALRGGRRWVYAPTPVRLNRDGGEPVFRAGGVCAVTGGLSAIGLGLAQQIRALAPVRLALIDTDGTDEPAGGTGDALVIRVPAYDAPSLEAAFRRIEDALGPITGVVHAAGMSEERPVRLIRDLDPATRARYWGQQEAAMAALDAVLRTRPVEVCMVMSSLAAEIGGLGQAAHAAAAVAFDTFAEARGWTVVNWDMWAADAAAAARAGFAITPAEGADAFTRLAHLPAGGRVVVATADPAARRQAAGTQPRAGADAAEGQTDAAPAKGHQRPDLVPYVAPRTEDEAAVAALWQEVLGIESIGINDNFFDLGGHSLIAAQLVSRLRRLFGVDVELDALFATPTVAQLAESLARKRPTGGGEEDLAALLDRLESMSEDEVAALLADGDIPAELLSSAGIK
ncbi:acyl transferase domain-containing protein [Azospirillum fermentarium]|uniref:type I polyketide synthase n=1 Tax=Azospirillum fermentarium TaxID=1233114 RepID=UPI002227EA04|nr:type I polyketide synthase [Azospirillum fermentarium]MCW2248522.1 acyl transferase domain-containing protein [Azospirillum fermentarium]